MLEYSALLQSDFTELLSTGFRDIAAWATGLSIYWYVAALVLFLLLIKLLKSS